MDVKTFKLISGEEVLGKVVSDDDLKIVLEDPRIISLQPTGPGQVTVTFIPFFLSNRKVDKATVNRSAVVAETEVEDELRKHYAREVSNIQLVN